MSDSDSDDGYELPSLAERIKASYQQKSKSPTKKIFNSEDEEPELLKVPNDIPCVPHSPVRTVVIDSSSSENEDSKFLKFSEKITTPCPSVKSRTKKISFSEDEEAEFLDVPKDIPCISRSPIRTLALDSSSSENEDSKFLKFSQKISTPCPSVKLKPIKSPESEDEKLELLKFSERIRTPCSTMKFKSIKLLESEDEDIEFLKFSERIGSTPCSAMKKSQIIFSDSDSDDVFSNLTDRFRDLHTPKSQNKVSVSAIPAHVPEEKRLSNSSFGSSKKNYTIQGTPKAMTQAQIENEKEYTSLFPVKSEDSLFCKKRVFYAEKLYAFFNKKVFDSQLPNDMPLNWDGSMVKTAGLTICKRNDKEYSCSIKLSSKLLTSFDRLQDTLLHEMCHAAVWMLNKVNVSHGPIWRIWASRCKLILPFIECPERCHTYDVPYSFYYQCTKCGWKRGACKRTKKYHGAVCKNCKTPISMTVNK